jgi:energy-coupling factor transporter ATP-binding protein EcfA2
MADGERLPLPGVGALMKRVTITVESPIRDSFRVRQVAGMFDLPASDRCAETFDAELPDASEEWDIGVIVGPSGSGKTTIARAAFGDAVHRPIDWPPDKAVIDCFGDHPIKRITQTLTSVGFSSPPAWLKPYHVLSNGEKFRCELARALSGPGGRTIVFDEFTSVVDRTVAKISSAAVAKWIRLRSTNVRFVAVTCHHDVVRWLQPDWVLDMSGPSLSRGRVRRPPIPLRVFRADRSNWKTFKRHHYLSGSLHRSSICFVGTVDGRPACFTAVLPFPHPRRPGWREHRTVCLPDFQGVGLGTAMSEFVASVFVATGKPYFSTTSHPAMIHHRMNSPLWRMHRQPGMVARAGPGSAATSGMARTSSRGRNTAGFEFIGRGRTKDARAFGIACGTVECESHALHV